MHKHGLCSTIISTIQLRVFKLALELLLFNPITLAQEYETYVKMVSLRILHFMTRMLTFVLYACFSSVLVSELTVSLPANTIRSFEEYLGQDYRKHWEPHGLFFHTLSCPSSNKDATKWRFLTIFIWIGETKKDIAMNTFISNLCLQKCGSQIKVVLSVTRLPLQYRCLG